MARIKLEDKVNFNGRIATLAELLDEGVLFVEKSEHFFSRRTESGETTKYFANIVADPMAGWEIGQKAYESRIAKDQGKK